MAIFYTPVLLVIDATSSDEAANVCGRIIDGLVDLRPSGLEGFVFLDNLTSTIEGSRGWENKEHFLVKSGDEEPEREFTVEEQ